MALPSGFLEDLRDRVSLSSIIGRKVTWDARKSNPARGDFWAPCPFHQEKTPSFHVDDRKGFYHCFGCHESGDAIAFLRKHDNLDFMEAVEALAREAGVAMPADDGRAQEKGDRLRDLTRIMDQASAFFQLQLRSGRAQAARDYLARRGLSEGALERFGIGFAPSERGALVRYLGEKGVSAADMADCGLTLLPEGGGAPFDRFRDRIMFPIRDGRGRTIAFGGRAMQADAQAKYLNSPETPLFHKGRTLFNIGPAREAAGRGGRLVVAEGYMDVIALSEAGFGAAVAPLGTAITEEQLQAIWRISPEPVIALDGDRAGQAAALRLADLALPLLEAGRGLRFALIPGGQDPDDIIRAGGAAAMEAVLAGAGPMAGLLWQRETEGRVFDSPERRAALDRSLKAILAKIRDPSIRAHYTAEFKSMRNGLFRPAIAGTGGVPSPTRGPGRPPRGPAPGALAGTRGSLLARGGRGGAAALRVRESLVLALCLRFPSLVERHEAALDTLTFHSDDLENLRRTLLTGAAVTPNETALSPLLSIGQVRVHPALRAGADEALAGAALTEELKKLAAGSGLAGELAEAKSEMGGEPGEGLTWRLGQAREAQERAERAELEESDDDGEKDRSRHLQDMIDAQVWVKKRRNKPIANQ
jgi:DNA primase